MAVKLDILLPRGARCLGQGLALGDQDLRAHDVDAGHLLGDGVFDLDARIDLDEVETLGLHIHQELDRAGAFVIDRRAYLLAQCAQLFALGLGQIWGRGALHDFLVAPLDRAVPLPEVIQMAVLVAEDLHLDVAGAQDHLFEIPLAVAEGGLGLAPALAYLLDQLAVVQDRPHAAPAAAPGRLEHQRIADLGGLPPDLGRVLAQDLGRGDHRHARRHGDAPRARLVAERPHRRGRRPDEGDPRRRAGINEIGILGQKAIARVDRVGT